MNIAVIDMGTNTFQLLVGKATPRGYTPIFKKGLFVRLGKDGISQGKITDEAMARAIVALKKLKAHALDNNAFNITATATSAIRSAKNSSEFLRKIKEETGVTPKVIDGNEEAELIYHGVRSVFNPGSEKIFVLDIGGGSVEFVIANGKTIFWKQSIEIGAQRLIDEFHQKDPIPEKDIARLVNFFNKQLKGVIKQLEAHQPQIFVGCAGIFDTLQDIYTLIKKLPRSKEQVFEIPIKEYAQIHLKIVGGNREERLAIPGMLDKRVDMIVVASILAEFLLRKGDFKRLVVSKASLKEGVLFQLGKKASK